MIERLKLAHKGLIVTLLPFVFEVAFVGLLALLLNSYDHQMEREAHSKDTLAAAYNLGRLIVNTSGAAAALAITGSDNSRWRLIQYLQDAHKLQETLRSDVAGQPLESRYVDDVGKSLDIAMATAAEYRRRAHGTALLSITSALNKPAMKKLIVCIKDMDHAMKELAGQEEDNDVQSSAAVERSGKLVAFTLACGLVMNIALTVFLAAFFARNITWRLKHVAGNAERLAGGKTPDPPTAGADEIAILDEAVYKTAREIAEKQQAKEALVAVVSHELRTPLMSVNATILLLKKGAYGLLNAAGKQKTDEAERTLERLTNLITDLIDIEKMESGKAEIMRSDIDLRDIVECMVADTRALAGQRSVDVSCGIVDDALFTADKTRLLKALNTLAAHAVLRSPPGQSVVVAATASGGKVDFTISDHGPLIARDDLEAYFARFQKPDARAHRSASQQLRLALARIIVEQHGGMLKVEDSSTAGTVFKISIPYIIAEETA